MEDFSWRALALFLAIVLWFVATERPQRNVTLDVRHVAVEIEFVNINDDLDITQARRTVDISFEGPRLILPFHMDNARALVDLAQLGPGTHSVPVRVELPTGLSLKAVQPGEIQVVLEERVRRRVPVSVSVDGVPPGVVVRINEVIPEEVDVFGPSSSVDRIVSLAARIAYSTGQVSAILTPVDDHGLPVDDIFLTVNTVDVHWQTLEESVNPDEEDSPEDVTYEDETHDTEG